MGDASFPVDEQIWAFFDRWLKDKPAAFASDTPHVRYFTMGANRWQSDSQWPPKAAQPVRMYLRSDVHANSLYGDGVLSLEAPTGDEPERSEEHTSALQSLMRNSYAVFCLQKKKSKTTQIERSA